MNWGNTLKFIQYIERNIERDLIIYEGYKYNISLVPNHI